MEHRRPARGPTLTDLFPSEDHSASTSLETAPAIGDGPGVRDARFRKKDGRSDPNRPLDAWERYRALNDAMDEAYELMDHSNREARFALLVMGILNAFVVIGASRTELAGALGRTERLIAAGLLSVYAVTAVYFLFQAIAALRPGKYQPDLASWNKDAADYPRGLRYYEDVIQRDAKSHWQAWREVPLAQLNAELAVQHHSLCLKANAKRVAQARLFAGLRVMVLLEVCLMALFVYAAWI
jgi:hypothetical protein